MKEQYLIYSNKSDNGALTLDKVEMIIDGFYRKYKAVKCNRQIDVNNYHDIMEQHLINVRCNPKLKVYNNISAYQVDTNYSLFNF